MRLARPPVEVLHEQPLAATALGPALEVLPRGREAAGRQDGAAEPLDQPQRGVRRRVHDLDVTADLADRLGVRLRLHVGQPVAELGGAVPHRAQHEVRLRPVEAPSPEDAGRLHHQQRAAVVVDEVRSELVAEEPPRRHAASLGSRPSGRQRLRGGAAWGTGARSARLRPEVRGHRLAVDVGHLAEAVDVVGDAVADLEHLDDRLNGRLERTAGKVLRPSAARSGHHPQVWPSRAVCGGSGGIGTSVPGEAPSRTPPGRGAGGSRPGC